MISRSFVFLLLLLITSITIVPTIFADDDDEEDRLESQIQEEEREEEEENDDDEGGIPLGTDTGNIILYGTIAAIVASIGYTAFKIISSKRKSRPSLK